MLIWYFSNKLDIYDYVGKLPEEHFNVWLFSNPGDSILFLLKFNEARVEHKSYFLWHFALWIFYDSFLTDLEKYNFFTRARIEPKLFTPIRCVNYNKSEFAIKQSKMFLTACISKKEPPHNDRGNNYVIHSLFLLFFQVNV